MKFKLLVILAILIFSIHSVAYSHSGRTNSSGCHRVTATGDYHCHGGGSSSSSGGSSSSSGGSSSSRSNWEEGDGLIVVGGLIILVAICWIVIDPDNSCLLDASHNQGAAHRYLNQRPMRILDNLSLIPRFDLTRQDHSGWEFRASYVFRF